VRSILTGEPPVIHDVEPCAPYTLVEKLLRRDRLPGLLVYFYEETYGVTTMKWAAFK